VVHMIVPGIRVHMDRGRPRKGPNHGDCNAGAEQAAHAESLSQPGLTTSEVGLGWSFRP
jgi:hypothetical protein